MVWLPAALALGLAAGAILIMQTWPDFFGLPSGYTRAVIESVFDGIVCVAGLASGIYLFYKATRHQEWRLVLSARWITGTRRRKPCISYPSEATVDRHRPQP